LIEARLKTIEAFKEVAGASDMTNIMSGRLTDHGCYTFQERINATESVMVGATMQRLTVLFAVLIVVRNVKDTRGADAADASHTLQDHLKTALLGWSPDSTADPLQYSGGALVSFANGFHIWKDTYTTKQFIRAI
jgi:hypothetical protein